MAYKNIKVPKTGSKISIKDGSGATIATCDSGNDKESEKRKPTSYLGLNRFVWDLTENGPTSLDDSLKVKKYEPFSKEGGGPAGAKVKPGKYQVVVDIGGQNKNCELEVISDPRISVADEDFAEQQDIRSEAKQEEPENRKLTTTLSSGSARCPARTRREGFRFRRAPP